MKQGSSIALQLLGFAATAAGTFVGCSLHAQHEDPMIRIQIPRASSSLESPNDLQRLISPNFASGMLATLPTTLDGFACLGLNVIGPGIPANAEFTGPNSQSSPSPGPSPSPSPSSSPSSSPSPSPSFACTQTYPGILGGLIPITGGEIDVSVPAGPARTFQLFGMPSATIQCPTMADAMSQNLWPQLSQPFFLGQSTTDISDDTSVTIKAVWDPNNPAVMGCDNGGGGGGGGTSTSQGLISVIAPASAIVTGQCAQMSLSAVDGNGNVMNVPSNISVSIADTISGSTSPGSVQFFSDSSCTNPSTSVTISAGTSGSMFFVRDPVGEILNISASAPGTAMGTGMAMVPFDAPVLTSGMALNLDAANISGSGSGPATSGIYPTPMPTPIATWADLSGSGNNGTINYTSTAPSWDGSPAPAAFHFTSSGQYVTATGGTFSLTPSTNFSLDTWLRLPAGAINAGIANVATISPGIMFAGFTVGIDAAGSLLFQLGNGGSSALCSFTVPNFPTTTWVHLAVVYDGSNVTIYVNGIQMLQSACAAASLGTTPNEFALGYDQSYYGSGSIALVHYYPTSTLTQSEVRSNCAYDEFRFNSAPTCTFP